MIDLDALAQAASCLEPLPTSVTRLTALVCAGSPDLQEVTEVVQYDQALTAVLLRAANSSWSASRSEVATVKDAVVRLGVGNVLSMAMGVNVRSRLDQRVDEYGLDEGDLWTHAVASALAAELIVRAASGRLPGETVTAALLHDIGKLVMARFLSRDLLEVMERAHDQAGLTLMASETEILGVHHAELGGLIVQHWGLPESLARGIAYHHTPDQLGDSIAYGVHLADVVAKQIGAGRDDNPDLEAFAHAMAELGLSADDYDGICRTAQSRLAEVLARYDV